MTFQNFLLTVNAVLIACYLWETRKLRKAAEAQVTKSQSQISAAYEQVEEMRHETAVAQAQLEAQIRPALAVSGRVATLQIVKISNGPTLNLQLVKGRTQTILPASSRVETNFGMRVKGCCVAPGESQAKDTNEPVGSIGQIRGEDLQLVYKSLSGKKYVSLIEFDGPGNPCKPTLYAP